MHRYAVILVAGTSQRWGSGDKCLLEVAGLPIALHSLRIFEQTQRFAHYIIVVRSPKQQQILQKFLHENFPDLLSNLTFVFGGSERYLSVFSALQYIHQSLDPKAYVYIHDGARPLITLDLLQALDLSLSPVYGVTPAHRIIETVMSLENSHMSNIETITVPIHDQSITTGAIMEQSDNKRSAIPIPDEKNQKSTTAMVIDNNRKYLNRDHLWALETPQAFYFPALWKDYLQITQNRNIQRYTDETSIFSGPIHLIENCQSNIKLTYPEDLPWVKFVLSSK